MKSKTTLGTAMLFTALITIKYKGEGLVKMPEIVAQVPWGMFFLLATVFYVGGILTNPTTNIPVIMEMFISNTLQGLDYTPFLLLTLALAFVMTNLMNSIVIGIIVGPIIATVALGYGFPVMPTVALFVFVLATAVLTPAAGVPGALLYGNKEWLPGNARVQYAVFFSIVSSIAVLLVGLPLAMALF